MSAQQYVGAGPPPVGGVARPNMMYAQQMPIGMQPRPMAVRPVGQPLHQQQVMHQPYPAGYQPQPIHHMQPHQMQQQQRPVLYGQPTFVQAQHPGQQQHPIIMQQPRPMPVAVQMTPRPQHFQVYPNVTAASGMRPAMHPVQGMPIPMPTGIKAMPVASGPGFVMGTPSMSMGRGPIVMRPPPGTVVASPAGMVRMPVMTLNPNVRPVLIAAGPPSIIKNPLRTKALLERPVPTINIKQQYNTLLSNFWGENIDVAKDGRIIDRSEPGHGGNGSEKKQRSPRQTGIVVGIDFGNTFTGVSYAHQGDGEMIDVVRWPRHLNSFAKVPTVSLYKTNENKGLVDWGSSALAAYKRSKTDRVLIKDYKLLLFDQEAKGHLSNGMHLTDVFTQYLQSVHRHVLDEVNKSQVLAAESVPIHYCITVPQAWTLPTRELILRCYVEAGIILQTPAVNMTVITEAEAAATYCREKCEEFESLSDGDIFMICDAGGLTTTVTVFRVDDALGVRQFVRMSSSHAENCGAVILDRKFRELMLQRLQGLDLESKPQRQKAFETLLEGFSEVKVQFDGASLEDEKHISVPLGLEVRELDPVPSWLEDEYMTLSCRELCEKVFDPVIEMVQELIWAQSKVHPVCAGLFLVGGLGANKYMLKKLEAGKNHLGKIQKPGSPVPQPNGFHGYSNGSSGPTSTGANGTAEAGGVVKKIIMVTNAELAVARGAVIYGLKSASANKKIFL